jgi:hypothetical protein
VVAMASGRKVDDGKKDARHGSSFRETALFETESATFSDWMLGTGPCRRNTANRWN